MRHPLPESEARPVHDPVAPQDLDRLRDADSVGADQGSADYWAAPPTANTGSIPPGMSAASRVPRRHRSARWLTVVTAIAVAIAAAAFLVGRGFRTPAQEAAQASAPRPSLITAPVLEKTLRPAIVVRATLKDEAEIAVRAPSSLSGDLPVVTALPVHRGSTIVEGNLLMAVAQRPIILLRGSIPAFRTINYGDSGVDVAELQAALVRLGFGISGDEPGTYGVQTGRAVASLYTSLGYRPEMVPVTLSSGRARPHTVQVPDVPLGEIVFVPTLPRVVVHLGAGLGQQLSSGGAAAQLSSGRLLLGATVDSNTLGLLRVGEPGVGISDLTGQSIRVKIASLGAPAGSTLQTGGPGGPVYRVEMVPTSPAAEQLIGQNLAIHLHTLAQNRPQLVVPAAAIVTNADAQSTVIVIRGRRQVPVAVQPGISNFGQEAVTPTGGELRAGDQVVIGTQGP